MTTEDPVRLLSMGDGIFEIRLCMGERRNPLTVAVLDAIGASLAEADAGGVRALVLTGEGKTFCAGADLHSVHNTTLGDRNEVGLGASLTWERLEWFRAPTIAAVQGHAITGGFNLALCCDLIVAETGAVFQDSHARWGLVPGSGEVQRLVRRLGPNVARDLLFTSRPFTAEEANERGLVSRLAPHGEARSVALEMARDIGGNSRRALEYVKVMANVGADRTVGEARWFERFITERGAVNTRLDPDRDARLAAFRKGRAKATPDARRTT